MISVIMPTMWKPEGVLERIKLIEEQPSVGEIIVIDNSNDDDKANELLYTEFCKVTYMNNGENIYVNPSWNLGVKLAN
jgi:hypothetical protein